MRFIGVLALSIVGASVQANVWLLRHNSRTAIIDTVGTASVGVSGDGTVFSEVKVTADKITTVREFRVDQLYFEKANVLKDGSAVVGYAELASNHTKEWVYTDLKKQEKSASVTVMRPPEGCEIIDTRFVQGKPSMLIVNKQGQYRIDSYDPVANKFNAEAQQVPPNIDNLIGFPVVGLGGPMLAGASQLLQQPINTPWYQFFGGNGSSPKGSFEPATQTLAVKGASADGRVSILRATPTKTFATLSVKDDLPITQILISGGQTFVAKQNVMIAVFDETGNRLNILNGNYVCSMN